ncbi:MAG TPA: hypothetical protein VN377_06525, partial [Candidatus Thermoplasmatota archaeon]|nr:hypothetical protein [Candidatus Thermoplasmatota archaeon]
MVSTNQREFLRVAVALLLLCSIVLPMASADEYLETNIDTLPYKQEITVPLDTSKEIAKYQPIDMRISFDNPCWGINETIHSIRVGVDDGTGLQEIESQIYDLESSDETHVKACSLVFLIPQEATGKEKYYVLYDSKETDPVNYPNHVTVEDTHYFYEPIPGQKIDFDYYGIRQDGFVIYAVIQKGQLLGNPIALSAIKFKPNSTTVETFNLDQLGNFDFRYGVPGEPDYVGTSWATEITKTVLVQGNLMVRVRLECTAPRGDIRSDNIYSYYYSPTNAKRILIDAHHETLKSITIDDPTIMDGVYTGITSIKSRSASIEKMNVGEILPTVYVFTEENAIQEYSVPQNPESTEREQVLSTQDDVELGSKAWACLGDATSGKVHGIIFSSNTGITEGSDDGVQIKVFAKQNIKLPGLEADTGNLYLTRNAFENGNHQTTLDQGKIYQYKVEFLTVETGGYTRVDEESTFYQSLIKNIPVFRGNVTEGEGQKERYTLTVYAHFARSVPLGSLFSAALGKNISYIYAELYQMNSFRSSGSVGRLSLGSISLNMTGKNLREKLQMVLGIFDWKNLSLFKKIRFPDLDPGNYLVKIYRENPRFAKDHQYIGFAIVNLTKDSAIRIRCRPQGAIAIALTNQEKQGVENVRCVLEIDNTTIAEAVSDPEGNARLFAPCYSLKPYQLKIFYQGFLIGEEQVRLNGLRRIIDMKKSFSLEQYGLSLTVTDTWGFPPAIDVNPTLVSDEMATATSIRAEPNNGGTYHFSNLLPASYRLSLSYKAFRLEQDVTLDQETTVTMMFPAEFALDLSIFNSYADRLSSGEISLQRNGKTQSTPIQKNGTTTAMIPPGDYEILVHANNEEIAQQQIQVRGEKTMDLITSQGSFVHTMILYLGLLFLIGMIGFLLWKKKLSTGIKLITISLLIIALVSPWWALNGGTDTVSTTTNTMVIPPKLITLTKSSNATGGEISAVPAEVTMVLGLLSMLVGAACLLIFFSVLTERRLRKTTLVLSVLSIVVILLTLIVFYYAFSQLTQVGVGSFMGSGTLDVTIPGHSMQTAIPCAWGPGIGFYLLIVSFVLLLLTFFMKRIKAR